MTSSPYPLSPDVNTPVDVVLARLTPSDRAHALELVAGQRRCSPADLLLANRIAGQVAAERRRIVASTAAERSSILQWPVERCEPELWAARERLEQGVLVGLDSLVAQ